jgi:tripartite-type tricarboxylate transporter receptor subunit TctC
MPVQVNHLEGDMPRLFMMTVAALLGLVGAGPLRADETVRIVFPFAAGASADALTRIVAEQLQTRLGRNVIVENRTGAAGRLGIKSVKDSEPDGSTLLVTPIAPMVVYQHVYQSLGYDPIRDFEPVAQIATFDFAVAVGPQVPVRTLGELTAWIRSNPAQANYGTPAAGTLPHFFAVLFGRATGLGMKHVPYKGTAAAMTDLLGGQIPMLFTSTSELIELHKAGRIHVLATSGTERSPFLPEVPTFQEEGYAIHGTGWHGLFAPKGTAPDLLDRLNGAVVDAVRTPEVRDRLARMGFQPTGTSQEAFAVILRRDAELWAPAVKASGFTPEQ